MPSSESYANDWLTYTAFTLNQINQPFELPDGYNALVNYYVVINSFRNYPYFNS